MSSFYVCHHFYSYNTHLLYIIYSVSVWYSITLCMWYSITLCMWGSQFLYGFTFLYHLTFHGIPLARWQGVCDIHRVYSSGLLRKISKLRRILARQNSTDNSNFSHLTQNQSNSVMLGFFVILNFFWVTLNYTLSIPYTSYHLASGVPWNVQW